MVIKLIGAALIWLAGYAAGQIAAERDILDGRDDERGYRLPFLP